MALDENGIEIINEPSESEKRIRQLSSTAKGLAEERDLEKKAREEAEGKIAEATRERDFYQGFSEVLSTNPQASEHRDDIKAKVLSGYTMEDATFAVLGKAGKLGQPKEVEVHQNIAGGSASIGLTQDGTKSVSEMTRDEKRAALMEAEKRGDIGLS